MCLLHSLLPWMPLVAFHLLFGIKHVVLAAVFALVGTVGNLLVDGCHFRSRATKVFPKLLDVGFLLTWLVVLAFTLVTPPRLNQEWAAVLVNACMFGVSVLSVGLNQPFTMHYEIDEVDEECASSSKFLSLHHSTTLDWALGFAAMAGSTVVGRVLLSSARWQALVFDTIIPLAILFFVFRLVSSLPAYLSRRTKAHEDRDGGGQQHHHDYSPLLPPAATTSSPSRPATERVLLVV